MTESIRKTQARIVERERQRHAREQKQRLLHSLPFVLVGLLVVIGAGLVVYGQMQAASDVAGVQGPRLQLDRDQIDFGDLHLGTTVRATFKITNAGDGTLHLEAPQFATVVEGC